MGSWGHRSGYDPRRPTGILLGVWTLLGAFFAYLVPYALDPEGATGGVRQFLPESLAGTLIDGVPFVTQVCATSARDRATS